MTPFGQKLRDLREARRCQLKDLAKALRVSSAYLSALEHGHRGKPSPGLVQQVAAYFNLAWEEVDELKALGHEARVITCDLELAEAIRSLMFVFDDLCKLSDKDIQTVLKNVETAQWAMALKGASPELKQKIMGNMSQRAAAMLAEEMDYLGAVRLSEVEQVQQQIVAQYRPRAEEE